MFYWNTTGFVGVFLGIAIGVGTSEGLAHMYGESSLTKGLGLLAGGASIVLLDLYLRSRHDRAYGKQRYFNGDFGGVSVLPLWMLGVVLILGGVSVMFSNQ